MLHGSPHSILPGSGLASGPNADRQRRGIAILETALILPLLLIITFGMIEYAVQFYVRGEMTHAAREAARELAVHDATINEATNVAKARLSHINAAFNIVATLEDKGVGANDRDATVRITVPVSDISSGIVSSTEGRIFVAEVTMRREDE